MKTTTSNPQSKPINQKRGPTTGNTNTGSKHADFVKAKASSGNERSALADMVTAALENRGTRMKSYRDPAVEPLKATVNVGRKGSRKGNQT
jgi:hypothetical protein